MIVYSNSDSFGIVSDGKVYSEFIAEHFSATLINKGQSGCCNTRIFRTSVRDLINLKKTTNDEIIVLIGLAPIWRDEYWKPGINTGDNDGDFKSFHLNKLLTTENKHITDFVRLWFAICDDDALVTNLLYELITFTSFLEQNSFRYLIWSGFADMCKAVDLKAPFISDFNDTLKTKHVISITDFSFCKFCILQGFIPIDYDQFKNNGHHGELAHKAFAEYIIQNYLEKNEI